MSKKINPFQVKVRGKFLDYRLGKKLDQKEVKNFFSRKYQVKKLWSGGRHFFGIIKKNNQELFLKLATSPGISFVSQIEAQWNQCFNQLVQRQQSVFWVPQNYDQGLYNHLFYLITDKFDGELFVEKPKKVKISKTFLKNIPLIIKFAQLIEGLKISNLPGQAKGDNRKWFLAKTSLWYQSIPLKIRAEYRLAELLNLVKNNYLSLEIRPRHGDFTPWHLFKLKNGGIGLIDAEHATQNGVEYYDLGYFIQRVFCVLENPRLAQEILSLLIKKKYHLDKLRVILAARAIGGFLDESLTRNPNYDRHDHFKNWVIGLKQS